MADGLKNLIFRRGIIKASLTRFNTYLNKFDAENSDNFLELEDRLSSVRGILEEFNVLQYEIEILQSLDSDEIIIDDKVREEFENFFYTLTASAKCLLKQSKTDSQSSATSSKTHVTNPSRISNHSNNINDSNNIKQNSFNQSNFNVALKLPEINLPTFDGSFGEWLFFRDTFRSVIHDKPDLSKTNKFHYLRLALKGEAAEIIKDLQISENSYDIAWQCLIERYEDESALISYHIKSLLNIPVASKESAINIRNLHDSIRRNIRVLKTLGEPVEYWDTLIIHLMHAKLDSISKRRWEEKTIKLKKPSSNDFTDFLLERYKILQKSNEDNKHVPFENKSKAYHKTRSFATTTTVSCHLCKQNHNLSGCPKFLALNPKQRYDEIKKFKLCVNCLRSNHSIKNCSSSKCRKCSKMHNTLLHFESNHNNERFIEPTDFNQESNSKSASESSHSTSCCSSTNTNCTLLSTAIVNVPDISGKMHSCRVLLDSGSQNNFISKEFCSKLNLNTQKIKISVSGLNQFVSKITNKVLISIHSITTSFQTTLSCLVIDNITSNVPCSTFEKDKLPIPTNISLSDPDFNISKPIDILLGAEVFWDILCVGQIKLGYKSLVLQKTLLGWIASGSLNLKAYNQQHVCNISAAVDNSNFSADEILNEQLKKFWSIEERFENTFLSPEEMFCEEYFSHTHELDPTGRFIVKFPLKHPIAKLGDSREIAEHRFYALENKLNKNANLKRLYTDFITEYRQLGHMSLLPDNSVDDGYFLPHHCVLKDNSLTTKLRVVFDASCKTSSGISLNDIIMVGPTIQSDLFSVLIRFRMHNYVLGADIEKMYRQVLIHKDHRHLQRILWRNNSSDSLSVYELNTITYGTASAAFLATRCIKEVSDRIAQENPLISSIIAKDFYVDDLLTGARSISDLECIKSEITKVLSSYGFPLRKFISNCPDILNNNDLNDNSVINLSNNEPTKTLGLLWHPKHDAFLFPVEMSMSSNTVTKRSILSSLAQIFDPLGLLSPLIVTAKVILQSLWQLRLAWDESVPMDVHTKWNSFKNDLNNLKEFNIPRHVLCTNPNIIEIHGFADASETAYGACVYLRSTEGNKFASVLLCSKTRVAPLKTLTIPRLELCAALILVKLVNKIISILDIKIDNIFYYSDSTIVLSWINTSPHLLKIFVANRVAKINTLSKPHQWGYVNTRENPADLLSRGISSNDLFKSNLWWHGPQWLQSFNILKITNPIEQVPLDKLPEIRNKQIVLVLANDNSFQYLSILNKYSTLNKVRRIFAYVLRFIRQLRKHSSEQSIALSPVELDEAMITMIILVQKEFFYDELKFLRTHGGINPKSKILKLAPFLDARGVLRVGGRLKNSELTYSQKHPALLPKGHTLSILILKNEHEQLLHAGPQQTLASVRLKYWPLSGRNSVRKVVHECMRCFRFSAKPIVPLMGELPTDRVVASRPFIVSGLDYAGPFYVKNQGGRKYKLTKAYICLFICFATKAIHLELVSDLSTNLFLAALRRFFSRRGKCRTIYSDNATNFVGANAQLQHFFKSKGIEIENNLAQEGITWKFIPPRAPHFGGLWERAVKSVKHHLRRVLGDSKLTFEEFTTLLTQIEACLNSRPIHPLSDDPNDPLPLTPAHFLVGEPLSSVPEPSYLEVKENLLDKYQAIQKKLQHFWIRWSREYITELQTRSKWRVTFQEQLIPGALVLVKENDLPPLKWLMGRVTGVFPGADGIVRTASIKTLNGLYQRPVAKLCVLPMPSPQ